MSTGQGAGATNGDFFDYTGVKSCMDSLDQKFSEFAELLRSVNDYMNDNIHIDHNSAIFGLLGEKFLNDWNENASTFGDFYENFSVWNQLMVNIMNQYGGFDDAAVKNAIGQNQSSGATLAGVAETRAAIWENNQLQDFKEANLVAGANGVVEEGVVNKEILYDGYEQYTYIDGTVVTYEKAGDGSVQRMIVENVDGTIDTKLVLEDGGMVIERYDVNGKAYSSDIVGANGEVLATRNYTDDYKNETITFYNADGSKDTIKIYDDSIPWNTGMKNVTTTDMVMHSDAFQQLFYGKDARNISSGEILDITKSAVVENNLERDFSTGVKTADTLSQHGTSTDILDNGYTPHYADRYIDKSELYSTNEQKQIDAIIDYRKGAPVEAVQGHDIEAVRDSYRTNDMADSYGQQSAAFQGGKGTTRPSGTDGNVTSGNTVLYNSGYNTTMPSKTDEEGVTNPAYNNGVPVTVPNAMDDEKVEASTLVYNPNTGEYTVQPVPYNPSDEAQLVLLGQDNNDNGQSGPKVYSC
ncbi:MAG: hypothetical protein ACI4OP_08125 [Candidatus Coprovivens sp.]